MLIFFPDANSFELTVGCSDVFLIEGTFTILDGDSAKGDNRSTFGHKSYITASELDSNHSLRWVTE